MIPWLSPPVSESSAADSELLEGLALPAHRPLVLIAGFLNRYKYTDVLFDVAAQCETDRDDGPVFCFCGDGPLRADGESRFAAASNVRFLGWQRKEVVHALLRQAAIVLVPMSGFVLLEAASLGKAVIASKVEWHSELVSHEKTGLLVDPENSRQWVDAIERILARDDERRGMATAFRHEYDKSYTLGVAIKREQALYDSLIKASGEAKRC